MRARCLRSLHSKYVEERGAKQAIILDGDSNTNFAEGVSRRTHLLFWCTADVNISVCSCTTRANNPVFYNIQTNVSCAVWLACSHGKKGLMRVS